MFYSDDDSSSDSDEDVLALSTKPHVLVYIITVYIFKYIHTKRNFKHSVIIINDVDNYNNYLIFNNILNIQ